MDVRAELKRQRRVQRALLIAGGLCLALAPVALVGLTLLGMLDAFAVIRDAPNPTPDDLARGVYLSMSGSGVALLIVLAGVGLLIASHVRSKRLDALEREWRDELSEP